MMQDGSSGCVKVGQERGKRKERAEKAQLACLRGSQNDIRRAVSTTDSCCALLADSLLKLVFVFVPFYFTAYYCTMISHSILVCMSSILIPPLALLELLV